MSWGLLEWPQSNIRETAIACIFAGLMIISRTLLYLDEKEESSKKESDLVSSQKMKTLLAGNIKGGVSCHLLDTKKNSY